MKKPFYKKFWFWLVIGVIIIFYIGTSNTSKEIPTIDTDDVEISDIQKNSPKISKIEFEALKAGMTYEEVVVIVGSEGELLSQVNITGYDTRMYTWKGEGSIGANANVTFQNNVLTSKAQFGLK